MPTKKSTDEAVLDLLVKVNEKRAEIKRKKVRPQWKTNCTLGRDPDSSQGRVNIQTVRDASKLIELYGFLLEREKLNSEAAKALDMEYDGRWCGYTISEWQYDLKTRANQLGVEKQEKEVAELDKRVNKLVSPDQRREMELEALQSMLGD